MKEVKGFIGSARFLSGAFAGGVLLNHDLILQLVALLLKIFVPAT